MADKEDQKRKLNAILRSVSTATERDAKASDYGDPEYNYIHSPSNINIATALQYGQLSPEVEAEMRKRGDWTNKTDQFIKDNNIVRGPADRNNYEFVHQAHRSPGALVPTWDTSHDINEEEYLQALSKGLGTNIIAQPPQGAFPTA